MKGFKMKDKIISGEIKFISSNKNKLAEIKSFNKDIQVIEGEDIVEVLGTIDEVIIHKSIAVGKDSLIEDTIFEINDKEVVDIKYRMHELSEGDKSKWIASFAYNDGEFIYVYRGEIKGLICKEGKGEGFGFDPYFIPEDLNPENICDMDINYDIQGLSLAELNKINLKKFFNARRISFLNFLKDNFIMKVKIKDIPVWTGKYQI